MISKSVKAREGTRTFTVGVEYITEHEHKRALTVAGTAFEGGVDYATASDKAAWIHLRGVASVEAAALEMDAVAIHSKCLDPVYHLIIAYAKDEHPTREQVVSDAERLLGALDMGDHQYVLAAHHDTDDFHAHVIANRVGPDWKANSLWNERIIRERLCAEIAAERGWQIVHGHHNLDIVWSVEGLSEMPHAPERRLGDKAYQRLHERGELPWQDLARPYVLDAVDRAQSWEDLHRRLDMHGVVAKLVQRGARVQGLSFAEGRDAEAPGCGASRIDARCALSALVVRFGAFVPAHEIGRGEELGDASARGSADAGASRRWADRMRDAIVAEVDAAGSWSDLAEGLHHHGVVVKLVQRGGYVQGLAFAEGAATDAPGCGASRIDDRCKKAALEERFGPFPHAAQEYVRVREATVERSRESGVEQGRERGRERVGGTERVLREAGQVVDHARMRSEYGTYRKRFFAEKRSAGVERYATAWEREKAQREREGCERRRVGAMFRAMVRIGSRGAMRRLGYWAINTLMERRRIHEFAQSRARWEATKSALYVQRGQHREQEKPMTYQTFVNERAQAGDIGAQQVAVDFMQPTGASTIVRNERSEVREQRQAPEEQAQARGLTIDEVRACLEAIRQKEYARYERAKYEREVELQRVERPDDLEHVLDNRRDVIEAEVAEKTAFTPAEQASLKRYEREKKSWNPLTRAAAEQNEKLLLEAQAERFDEALRDAMRVFQEQEVPMHAERIAPLEQEYREYVGKSVALEEDRNDAWSIAEQLVPAFQEYLTVVERSGSVVRIEGVDRDASFEEITNAIGRCYESVPEITRLGIESQMRSEFERSRDLSMDR